jgi:hypothetical protein
MLMFAMHIRNLLLRFIRIIVDCYFFTGLLIRMFYISFLNIFALFAVLHISALWLSRHPATLLVVLLGLLLLVFLITHIAYFFRS